LRRYCRAFTGKQNTGHQGKSKGYRPVSKEESSTYDSSVIPGAECLSLLLLIHFKRLKTIVVPDYPAPVDIPESWFRTNKITEFQLMPDDVLQNAR
jgi:hypothetical protein